MNGDRLKEARRQARLTQTELGQRVGLSQSMIAALESNRRMASRSTEQALADALGVAVDSLLDTGTHPADSPEALLENQRTPPGLRALAADRVLAAALNIRPHEWRALRSLVLPAPVTKEGYLALLTTIRAVSAGHPEAPARERAPPEPPEDAT